MELKEMIEELIFNMYKDRSFKSSVELKQMIKSQFKNINDNMLRELTLRIYNYQILKYGACLYQIPDKHTANIYISNDIKAYK